MRQERPIVVHENLSENDPCIVYDNDDHFRIDPILGYEDAPVCTPRYPTRLDEYPTVWGLFTTVARAKEFCEEEMNVPA